MSERRKFMKGFGLLGAVLAGAATTKVVIEHAEKKEQEDISHLAPGNSNTLVLLGQPVEKEPVQFQGQGSSFYIQPMNHEYKNKVAMAVGKDDRLWIKVGEEWKRVSIES